MYNASAMQSIFMRAFLSIYKKETDHPNWWPASLLRFMFFCWPHILDNFKWIKTIGFYKNCTYRAALLSPISFTLILRKSKLFLIRLIKKFIWQMVLILYNYFMVVRWQRGRCFLLCRCAVLWFLFPLALSFLVSQWAVKLTDPIIITAKSPTWKYIR